MRDTATIIADLEAAIVKRDSLALEDAVYAAFEADLPQELAGMLAEVLQMPWHFRHEDVASALRTMRDAHTVTALFQTIFAEHEYLNHDELFGLARKCIWALADIGTPEARERLTEVTKTANATVAAYARKRLDRWEQELPRKGRRSVTPSRA